MGEGGGGGRYLELEEGSSVHSELGEEGGGGLSPSLPTIFKGNIPFVFRSVSNSTAKLRHARFAFDTLSRYNALFRSNTSLWDDSRISLRGVVQYEEVHLLHWLKAKTKKNDKS